MPSRSHEIKHILSIYKTWKSLETHMILSYHKGLPKMDSVFVDMLFPSAKELQFSFHNNLISAHVEIRICPLWGKIGVKMRVIDEIRHFCFMIWINVLCTHKMWPSLRPLDKQVLIYVLFWWIISSFHLSLLHWTKVQVSVRATVVGWLRCSTKWVRRVCQAQWF
jgi:hypothetical protein